MLIPEALHCDMRSDLWPILVSFRSIQNLPIAEPKLGRDHTLSEDILLVMHTACPSAGLIIEVFEVLNDSG